MPKKLIAGNWKMNGSLSQAQSLIGGVCDHDFGKVDVCVCPPFPYIASLAQDRFTEKGIAFGGQDCSYHAKEGAFTGEVSSSMLRDVGCRYVIVGHSERRQYHNETNEDVNKKALRAHEEGLISIICVGETAAEREADLHTSVVILQLMESMPVSSTAENLIIAYEPIWAIGTGKTATEEDVQEMHGVIRRYLQEKLDNSDSIRILYGGSVKPENAKTLLAIDNVDGALVGGASLKADQFLAIIDAAQ